MAPHGIADRRAHWCFYWPVVVLLSGCTQPDAATTDIDSPADEFPPSVVLDSKQQAQVLADMRAAAQGYAPRPLVTAPDGVRWSDVTMAIRNVADKQFLGYVSAESTADQCTVWVQMPDGQDGTIVARRDAGGRITATARLGVLGEPKQEQEFVVAFDAELRRLGAIARPQE